MITRSITRRITRRITRSITRRITSRITRSIARSIARSIIRNNSLRFTSNRIARQIVVWIDIARTGGLRKSNWWRNKWHYYISIDPTHSWSSRRKVSQNSNVTVLSPRCSPGILDCPVGCAIIKISITNNKDSMGNFSSTCYVCIDPRWIILEIWTNSYRNSNWSILKSLHHGLRVIFCDIREA